MSAPPGTWSAAGETARVDGDRRVAGATLRSARFAPSGVSRSASSPMGRSRMRSLPSSR